MAERRKNEQGGRIQQKHDRGCQRDVVRFGLQDRSRRRDGAAAADGGADADQQRGVPVELQLPAEQDAEAEAE